MKERKDEREEGRKRIDNGEREERELRTEEKKEGGMKVWKRGKGMEGKDI